MNKKKGFSAMLSVGILCTVLACSVDGLAADANPCAGDIANYCTDVKPGRGAIMDCLEQHENELTSACREHEARLSGSRMEMKEKIRERIRFRKACNNDMVKFCASVEPGKGMIDKCLGQHERELSAPCREMFKIIKQTKE